MNKTTNILVSIASVTVIAILLLGIGYSVGHKDTSDVVNGRFCPQSVRSFFPVVAGFNAGTYKVPACVL